MRLKTMKLKIKKKKNQRMSQLINLISIMKMKRSLMRKLKSLYFTLTYLKQSLIKGMIKCPLAWIRYYQKIW